MNIVIYNQQGEILRTVTCPKELASLQVRDGEQWLEGKTSDARSYIKRKKIVDKPEKPSPHHTFDCGLEQWVDRRSSVQKLSDIRQQRDQLLTESDWTQLPDVPDTISITYQENRQSLRDITNQPLDGIQWPTAPEV